MGTLICSLCMFASLFAGVGIGYVLRNNQSCLGFMLAIGAPVTGGTLFFEMPIIFKALGIF